VVGIKFNLVIITRTPVNVKKKIGRRFTPLNNVTINIRAFLKQFYLTG